MLNPALMVRRLSGFSLSEWLEAAALRAVLRLEEFAERQRSRRALASLDQRMLKDIGLSPCDAQNEAGKPCWKK